MSCNAEEGLVDAYVALAPILSFYFVVIDIAFISIGANAALLLLPT